VAVANHVDRDSLAAAERRQPPIEIDVVNERTSVDCDDVITCAQACLVQRRAFGHADDARRRLGSRRPQDGPEIGTPRQLIGVRRVLRRRRRQPEQEGGENRRDRFAHARWTRQTADFFRAGRRKSLPQMNTDDTDAP
jgi:hypothetical protein